MMRRMIRHYVPRPWRSGTHRRPPRGSSGAAFLIGAGTAVVVLALAFLPGAPRTPRSDPHRAGATASSPLVQHDTAQAERDRASVKPALRTATVRRGDSLWTIAQRELGDGARWREIGWINHRTERDVLQPGQRIALP